MRDDASDSSYDDDASGTSTNVLLGYASKEPTDDLISKLGGEPSWLDPAQPPSAALARCGTCNNHMVLLLQLNGDLPDRFPGHERRLYIWACKRKACTRKPGSVRVVRAVRAAKTAGQTTAHPTLTADAQPAPPKQEPVPARTQPQLGESLFGGKSLFTSSAGANPFASSSSISSTTNINPFSTASLSTTTPTANPFSSAPAPLSSLAAKPSQTPNLHPDPDPTSTLPETFAQKARISTTTLAPTTTPAPPHVPWPAPSSLPTPYPTHYLDADYEYLSTTPTPASSSATAYAGLMDVDADSTTGATTTDSAGEYESEHDKTFQHFADTLAQNPDQVLRYEYAGSPLLYSRADAVGRLFANAGAGIPPCGACGARRVFEAQLTPGAIAALEAEEEGVGLLGEGMEWGTVLVGVCGRDCGGEGGAVEYREEWAGVQWEEVVARGGRGR